MNRRIAVVVALSVVAPTVAVAALAHAAGRTGSPTDPTRLPIGDGKVTTAGARRGYVYRCGVGGGGGGAFKDGPWIKGDGTFDVTKKVLVDGSVRWAQARSSFTKSGTALRIRGNGLPTSHPTGIYPIQPGDDAYQYDRNPNSIQAQTLTYDVPASPRLSATPNCLTPGPIAVTTSGVVVFDGLDALNRDAVAHEIQDSCGGHPERTGVYHYHAIPSCLTKGDSAKAHSSLVGYALDGFGLYGPRGASGKLLTDAALDACHGHTHGVRVGGRLVRVYHYHATLEYPYTIGCFRGTPVR